MFTPSIRRVTSRFAPYLALCVACVAIAPSSSHAGANLGARALLSFSADSLVTAPPPQGAILHVYVWIEGAARLKGAEYTLRWHVPAGDSLLAVLGEKHPSGLVCGEYLLRGHSIGFPTMSVPNAWSTAFAADETDTTCTRGVLSELLFDATALAGRPATIAICSATLLDDGGQQDAILARGVLQMNGATQSIAPCTGPAPHAVSPRGSRTKGGATLILTGDRFRQGARVWIGGIEAKGATFVDEHHLSITAPAHAAGIAQVRVANTEGLSGWLEKGLVYSDAPPPSIDAIRPDTVGIGQPLTIQGSGFSHETHVRIGGVPASHVHLVSSTLLTVEVPRRRAGIATVSVENPDGQTFDWPGTIYLLATNDGE
jgi:hypothetical protein